MHGELNVKCLNMSMLWKYLASLDEIDEDFDAVEECKYDPGELMCDPLDSTLKNYFFLGENLKTMQELPNLISHTYFFFYFNSLSRGGTDLVPEDSSFYYLPLMYSRFYCRH